MDTCRIKHIPTGLYYKTFGINLTKKGQIYNIKDNVLIRSEYDLFVNTISNKSNRSLYNKLKKLFYKESSMPGVFFIPVGDFELEYILNNNEEVIRKTYEKYKGIIKV